MRKSRVLLAGVAVAAAGAATSAFTTSNTTTGLDNNVAGYGQVVATGVNVSNIAYAPATADASKLQSVTFTIDQDAATANLASRMTLSFGTTALTAASVCTPASASGVHTVTCVLGTAVAFADFDRTALTVTSN